MLLCRPCGRHAQDPLRQVDCGDHRGAYGGVEHPPQGDAHGCVVNAHKSTYDAHAKCTVRAAHGCRRMLTNAHKCTRDAQEYTHTFYPLVLLFCKQQETTESVQMAVEGLDGTCFRFFGRRLQHKVANMDHSSGLLAGMRVGRSTLPVGNCWPHLACARTSHTIHIECIVMHAECRQIQKGRAGEEEPSAL